jgi:hypothetical protein
VLARLGDEQIEVREKSMSVKRRRALDQRLGVEKGVEAAVDPDVPSSAGVPVPENTAAGTRSAAPSRAPRAA